METDDGKDREEKRVNVIKTIQTHIQTRHTQYPIQIHTDNTPNDQIYKCRTSIYE